MRHELDHRAMINKNCLRRGCGRATVALEELSQELSVKKQKLKDDNARATLYYKLIEECGPGDLATLGSGNNHAWEKILSLQDASFLVSFRHRQFPKVETAARELDFPIARLMIKALIACGWKYKELAGSKTRLLEQLSRFVDIQKLAQGEIIKIVNDIPHMPPREQRCSKSNGNKRKSTSPQPSTKKQRNSMKEQNVKFQYGENERMGDASCVLKYISTEGISEPASVPGIETTDCLKLPTSLQAESTTIISDDDNVEDNYGSNNGPQLLMYPYLGKKQAQVEAQDLKRLCNNKFLNDNLIGCYIRFLEDHLDRTNKEAANWVFFFNTYFYTTLTDRPNEGPINFKRVQNWTKGVDIFSHDYIVVPINESMHWYAAIICNLPYLQGVSKMAPRLNDMIESQNKANPYNDHPTAKVQDPVIITFDSLNGDRSHTVRKLRQYLAEEAKSKKGIGINTDLIAGLKAESLPMQSNFSDCAISAYVCAISLTTFAMNKNK
ncbi:hypothetical protein SI65_04149 [Aspergillus cristatus]|uniref:Ubiquitin-like protease family profile domain-containing protein n=1 Tax=Aspergillus cristatus TaxID=573508 RepID=A0A1E3BL34_ASPCR|nr:hypothetical protein SI65_04149 [Aspergillus cristatus]